MKRNQQQRQDIKRFSRAWWLGGLDTLLWVSVITMLIWLYADIEFTASKEISLTLQLTTEPGSQITLTSPTEHRMQVTLRGTQNALEQFERDLGVKGRVLVCDVTAKYDPALAEPVTVSAEDLLNLATPLATHGIDVASAQPETMQLAFQALHKLIGVPVDLVSTGAELQDTPTPFKVDVLIPEDVKALLGDKPLRLRTRSMNLSDIEPGRKHTIRPEILTTVTIGDKPITVTPSVPAAVFIVQVRSRTATRDIPVTVQILTPTPWAMQTALGGGWSEYVLERSSDADWKLKLKLRGTPTDLDSAENTVRVMVPLIDDDTKPTESWLEREVLVVFPPGSSLELVGPAPKMKFRLQKRKKPVN